MHLYINLGILQIPSYGLFLTTGVVIANLFALYVLHRTKLDFNNFIILESYGILGGFIGAKILYLIISYKDIEWKRITEPSYFNELMQGGFVFYGGLITALLFVLLAGKIHNINANLYLRTFVFLIPFVHCFGRIGCFMAGCCYGKPYDGFGAVVFPEGSAAPIGISLFPVQLFEATILFFISLLLLFFQVKKHWYYTVETYLITYGIARFFLEYLRYDEIRGILGGLSTSQWISICLISVGLILIFLNRKKLD